MRRRSDSVSGTGGEGPASKTSQRALLLLEEALLLPVARRAAFLQRACGGSPELQREVEALLAAEESAEDFLEVPVFTLHSKRRIPVDGQTLSHYKILQKLASGGMGEVYAARDLKLGRKVALKILPEEMATDGDRLERFEREARALAALNHPNIITIFSVEEVDGLRFFTMELVEGTSLGELIPAEGLSCQQFFQLALPLADALAAAHRQGIIHRDLKPGNVLVSDDGRLKVLDFGLAKHQPDPLLDPDDTLTQEGAVLGTMPYMSPEQVQGKPVDQRSDIFSFGILLFRMATGQKPFTGETPADLMASILRDTPRPVTEVRTDLPTGLARVVLGCLAKVAAKRYQTASEVRSELARLEREYQKRILSAGVAAKEKSPRLVGRQTELGFLRDRLEQVLARGERQVVFVTGEAGIGKTALLEAFLEEAGEYPDLCRAQGQCQELYGAGEAYMPMLEALDRVCRQAKSARGSHGRDVLTLLDRHAPSWLVQMPGLLDTHELEALRRRITDSTSQRMLREIAVALEALAAQTPLVLVLEDLHWSDHSTLDLVAALARRREPARLLIVGSFRPPEVLAGGHPLKAVHQDLQLHGQCLHLPLPGLDRQAVEESLEYLLPGGEISPDLVEQVCNLTEGNPLFVLNMAGHLLDRGHIVEVDGKWRFLAGAGRLETEVPDSLRQMIQSQIEALSAEERQLLAVGSVAGMEFCAAVTAPALDWEVDEADLRYGDLARRHQFIASRDEEEWPDGTLAGCYSFIHALYQNVFYQELPVSLRVRLHRRIGERLEAGYEEEVEEIAAVLAVHFDCGRDGPRAVKYYGLAAQKARRRSALQEATDHLKKGLELLVTLPPNEERHRQELDLETALAAVLSARYGYAAPQVEEAYGRAEELCKKIGESDALLHALRGLWNFYLYRARLEKALALGRQLARMVEPLEDPLQLLSAHTACGITHFMLGEPEAARRHLQTGVVLEQGVARDSSDRHSFRATTVDTGVTPRCAEFLTLWHLGYPDQALEKCHEMVELANEVAHPFSLAFALVWTAWLHQLRGETAATRERAQQVVSLSQEHGLFWAALGNVLLGWAVATKGPGTQGIAAWDQQVLEPMRRGLRDCQGVGVRIGQSYFRSLLAEACTKSGQLEEARQVLQDTLATIGKSGEGFWEAELHRLRGRLALVAGNPEVAESYYHKALEVGRHQGAKALELRAATSLARLWQSQEKTTQARELLSPVYSWFSEGFDTADLKEAKALVEQLGET